MVESKITTTPWTFTPITVTTSVVPFSGGYIVAADGESVVAQCVREADGRRIEAIDDLVSALRRLLESVRAHTETGEVHPPYTVEIRDAHTALAKAGAA